MKSSLAGELNEYYFRVEEEIWKDIPDYEGSYMVSDLGKIKSIKYNKERLLKPCSDTKGRLFVSLYKNGIEIREYIHKIVMNVFKGYSTDGTNNTVIDHKNDIYTDNRLINLQLISNRENCSKSRKNNSSSFRGVHWDNTNKKWISKIQIKGKSVYLYYGEDEEVASKYYETALINLDKYENSKQFKKLIKIY